MKLPKWCGKRTKSDLGNSYAREPTNIQLLGLLSSRILSSNKIAKKRSSWSPPSLLSETWAGKKLAASDDTVTPFDSNTYKKLSKKPTRAANHAQQVIENSLNKFELTVAKATSYFFSGFLRGQNLLVTQLYKNPIAKSNGPIGNEFLQKLTSILSNVIEGKVPVGLKLFFWC